MINLAKWEHGEIRVVTHGNQDIFYSGEKVSGSVFVNCDEDFQTKSLVVQLIGHEHVFFKVAEHSSD